MGFLKDDEVLEIRLGSLGKPVTIEVECQGFREQFPV